MFKSIHSKALQAMFVCAALGVAGNASAVDIARWSFNSLNAGPDNTPAATTDLTTASATQLGMTNSYNGGSNVAACDVLNTPGNTDPLGIAAGSNAWRIRATGANGWALAAPQYTQGAEFDVSTVGFSSIVLSFDFFSTTQGIRDLQVQYNTNINNANGWTNFAGSFAGNVATEQDATHSFTQLVATSNNWNFTATTTSNVINFATNGIGGVSNDANFGVRLVSAYDPSLGQYGSAAGGVYNNTSGNWRFDQIAVQGSAVPEPASIAVLAVGFAAALRKRRK